MTRLSAKTESGCTSTASRSPKNVSAIAPAPTSGGRSEATKPRKTQNESSRTSGNAISSARRRSLWIAAVTWREAMAPPPSRTCGSSANAASSRSAACFEESPPRRVQEREHDPVLVDRGAGDGRVTIDPGARALDDRRPAGDEREHARDRASTPVLRSTSRFASRLSDERSANWADPASMRGITVLPIAKAATKSGRGDERDEPSPGRDQVQKRLSTRP